MTARRVLGVLLAAGVVAVACERPGKQQSGQPGATGTSGRTSMSVSETLNAGTPVFAGTDAEGVRIWKLTRQFYQNRGEAPAWIDAGKPQPQMDDLIGALQHADREGLDPALYNVSLLAARRQEASRGFLTAKGFDASEAARLDVWLTYLYLRYASNLSTGLANLSGADPNWKMRADKNAVSDLLPRLEQAIAGNHVAKSLDELVPRHRQYVALRDALTKYRDLAKRGGWQPVPALPKNGKLKPGEHHAAVPAIARRLSITGDFTGAVNEQDTVYGASLQEAVKRFQARHGLEPNGLIGPAVIAQMNVPVETRISQLSLNLERWRWLPQDLGDRYLLVNIPEYRLEVWEHDTVPLAMRVVVGKKDTPTPIFADDMSYVVFAPYWNVPPDIVQKETLPSVLRDPAFLRRANMEVVDKSGSVVDPAAVDLEDASAYRFRQRPGASNSLGLVKFMFPNSFNVYLHDTPADSLFARATRSFSHGCVRVEQPEKLAQYVLADQPEWTREKIVESMHGSEERTVKLREKLPVYLGYWTARVSSDGILQFRDDLYGIDARQMTLLTAAVETMKGRADRAAKAFAAGTDVPAKRSGAAAPARSVR